MLSRHVINSRNEIYAKQSFQQLLSTPVIGIACPCSYTQEDTPKDGPMGGSALPVVLRIHLRDGTLNSAHSAAATTITLSIINK